MAPYFKPTEKSHILNLCTQHHIRAEKRTPRGTWSKIIHAMESEAQEHFPGGQYFEIDPWPVRHYQPKKISCLALRWMRQEAKEPRIRKLVKLQMYRANGGKTLTEIIEESVVSGVSVRTDFGAGAGRPGWV
ncbi:b155ecc9-7da0-466d-9bee-5c0d603b1dcc-CDS [Sclerotinia trifoliorum]|uniref:B155ecc9-7da0-466d-9bee-5c0d603b1dcc-CDS n=1 Tax=Sclerotinia trifoliorum TaxID=28548 RepID=A0A8H2W0H6_9HELO|nr:b155ecc9-7da0-466d-9bee-5c0d603b1dcc-CDS [Sclerotinia trifoliorum]